MTPRTLLSLAMCLMPLPGADAPRPSVSLPFTIDATEDVSKQFTGAPYLHSFVAAQYQGKWIFLAGRTNGYHGLGGGDTDFDRPQANPNIWVIDPSSNPAKVSHFPVSSLPERLAVVRDQWMSANALSVQDGETLYVAGGYGKTSAGEYVTYSVLSAVNLAALVDGVEKGKDTFSKAITFVESPLVQSTGGELLKLGEGHLYLAMGHVFMGRYSEFEANNEQNTAKVYQKYLGEIRKLKVGHGGAGGLTVALAGKWEGPEFARRDFNAAPRILPDGRTVGAAVYGGVFTKDQMAFTKPIYFGGGGAPVVDGYDQKMSPYSCARLLLFDTSAKTMYTTFFGGLSHWSWDGVRQTFVEAPVIGDKSKPVYQDGFPWIDQVSTLAYGADGKTAELVQTNRLPGYLGTNAVFLPVDGLKRVTASAEVFDVSQFRGTRVLAGYLYGGIRAYPKQFPYREESPSYNSGNVPTRPSNMILKVYVSAPGGRK